MSTSARPQFGNGFCETMSVADILYSMAVFVSAEAEPDTNTVRDEARIILLQHKALDQLDENTHLNQPF